MVQLKKIDRENVWDVARLKVKRAQMNYVSSNVESILEAFATRESGGVALPFALYDGVALVGFALIGPARITRRFPRATTACGG